METLYQLGITPSRSRPRVSNDNPYAESIFRTCKYRPGFPSKEFSDINESRVWVLDFVNWYNYAHRHCEIKFLTPHQRQTGMEKMILNKRKTVYESAKLKHPERWINIRNWDLDEVVWLNPDNDAKTKEDNINQLSS